MSLRSYFKAIQKNHKDTVSQDVGKDVEVLLLGSWAGMEVYRRVKEPSGEPHIVFFCDIIDDEIAIEREMSISFEEAKKLQDWLRRALVKND